ncbi:hypothetical protein [Parasphingopyxis sp.]|uniref:hypothetical protein n=1 Tax=Parasphingopyxis sp. TaxID=1920299 RepID=UPI0026034890|nr:hypothetical protein [Parasphingopyxis sp.]
MPDLDRAIADMEELLVEAGNARAKAEAMDERRKQVRSTMFVKYRGDGLAIGEAEHRAQADEAYKTAAAEWELANYDYRKTEARAVAKRLAFEAWRTEQSTERARMNLR